MGIKKFIFFKSVKLGESVGYNNLSNMYLNSKGVVQDYIKTREYYERAIKLGETIAYCNLAKIYYPGLGVDKVQKK